MMTHVLEPLPAVTPLLTATTGPYRAWAKTSARSQVRERRPAVDDVVDALVRARRLAQETRPDGVIGVLVIDAAGVPLWAAGEDLRPAVAELLDGVEVDAPDPLGEVYEAGMLHGADMALRDVAEHGETPVDEYVARRRAQLGQAAAARGVSFDPLGVAEPEIVRVPLGEDFVPDAPECPPVASFTARWRLIVAAAAAGAWEPQEPLSEDVDRDEALRELERRRAAAAAGERVALQEQSTIISGWQTIA